MSSSKFCRRPRIQPLPKVCKASPVTTSCYDRPTEPPEPLHVSGTLEILRNDGVRLYYSTFNDQQHRGPDYFWNLLTRDSEGNPAEPELEWRRPENLADIHITFAIPIWGGETFDWPGLPLTDAFPWLITLNQERDAGQTHICNATFWN